MAACTFVVKYASLHMCCLQGWLATVYRTMSHTVRDLLDWWTHPRNLVFHTRPSVTDDHNGHLLHRVGSTHATSSSSGTMVHNGDKPTYKPSRTPHHPQCLPPRPDGHKESAHKGHNRQHRLYVLYKLARRSQISFTLHPGHQTLESLYSTQHPYLSFIPTWMSEHDDR